MKKSIKIVLLLLLVAFFAIQFFQIDKTNPPFDTRLDYVTFEDPPLEVVQILKNSCYDCHSHETKYPWYTNVQPFGWWMKSHIDHAREEFNFSTWTAQNARNMAKKSAKAAEEVEATKMPLLSYTIGHSEAKMSKEQRQTLVTWFKSKGVYVEPPPPPPSERSSGESATGFGGE